MYFQRNDGARAIRENGFPALGEKRWNAGFRFPLYTHKKNFQRYTNTFFLSLQPATLFFLRPEGFCTLHENTKQKKKIKINRFTLPVVAESIIRSELFTSTHIEFNKKRPVSVYVKKFTIVQLKYSNHNYTRTPYRLFLSLFV